MWVALRSNKKTVFGHQHWCLVSVGSSFANHSLVPHGVDATPVDAQFHAAESLYAVPNGSPAQTLLLALLAAAPWKC